MPLFYDKNITNFEIKTPLFYQKVKNYSITEEKTQDMCKAKNSVGKMMCKKPVISEDISDLRLRCDLYMSMI